MGLGYTKESSLSEFDTETPTGICTECAVDKIELRMLSVGMKLCRKCYLKRKGDCFLRDMEFTGTSQINEITPKIFLGNNEGAKQKDQLHQFGITHVLVCGYYLHEYYPKEFTYMTVELEDNVRENLFLYLMSCIEFIRSASKVYVHCRAGISRSSSMVLGYLMYENRMSYSEAKEFVINRRGEIEPNAKFEEQLIEFEDIIKACEYKMEVIEVFLNSFRKSSTDEISVG